MEKSRSPPSHCNWRPPLRKYRLIERGRKDVRKRKTQRINTMEDLMIVKDTKLMVTSFKAK
jgi:hypothetical protein